MDFGRKIEEERIFELYQADNTLKKLSYSRSHLTNTLPHVINLINNSQEVYRQKKNNKKTNKQNVPITADKCFKFQNLTIYILLK